MIYADNIKISSKGFKFTDKDGNELTFDKAFRKAMGRVQNWILDFELFLIHLVSLHVPLWFIRKLVFKLAGLKMGKKTTIHMGAKFFYPHGVVIGEDTIIGDRAFLDGRDSLKIGSHVNIASEVMIYNSEHDVNDKAFKAVDAPVAVGDYVFVGPRVIILPGVEIGKGAVIAAGAVVTKNVDPFSIVAGVPAKPIGERRNKNLKYRLGRARLFQ